MSTSPLHSATMPAVLAMLYLEAPAGEAVDTETARWRRYQLRRFMADACWGTLDVGTGIGGATGASAGLCTSRDSSPISGSKEVAGIRLVPSGIERGNGRLIVQGATAETM